jgi:L-alanine-DL-glutamate epimerase-like enolase superfamily enzyme
MKLTARLVKLHAAHGEFRIARSVMTVFDGVIVELSHRGVVGIGEAAPSSYFGGETPGVVMKNIKKAGKLLGSDPFLIEDVTGRLLAAFPKAHASVCAIDLALHDLVGKMLRLPMYRFFGLDPEKTKETSFTIGIAEPAVMAERAGRVKRFKVLKVKVGAGRDEEMLKAIRAATDLPIRIDANTGWTKAQAVRTLDRLAKYNIQFCEQPIPEGDNEALRFIRDRSPIPIMADESCVDLKSLPALVGCVDMINIKLMKCGGLREAMRMIHFARAHGMKTMLGCMLETSVAITAAATLTPLVDYADLDGNYLIADDPFEGVGLHKGRLTLPDRPGLGVRERKV